MKDIVFSKPQNYKAKIITKNQLTETVYFVQYELLEPQELNFIAGQTVMLKITEGVNRAMSIASSPQEKHVIDSVQDVSPMGLGSKWLLERNVGDEVFFMAPLGRFVINKDNTRKKLLVATGTGIAPFRAMIYDQTDQSIAGDKVILYWGLRYKKDIYLQNELEEHADKNPNFQYFLILSKPSPDWNGLTGHVQDHVFVKERDLKNCDYYLCGNKNMIKEVGSKLSEFNISKEQIFFDPYY